MAWSLKANQLQTDEQATRPYCRGAANGLELERQAAKTVAAISLDAAVIGVQELENDGYGPASAGADLVDRLNAATAPGTYAALAQDQALWLRVS